MTKEIVVKKRNGKLESLDIQKINKCVERACANVTDVSASEVILDAQVQLYNKIPTAEIDKALIMSARAKIEKEPSYQYVAARLLLNTIYKEVFGEGVDSDVFEMQYRKAFVQNLKALVKDGRVDKRLLEFDLKRLSAALDIDADDTWKYLGIQTVYDRYLLHINGRRMESPQAFWMRVAMGLSLNEADREASAIEFYRVLSSNRGLSSTPTLFNAGTIHSQLSSCYLSTIEDSIDGIFGNGIHGQARLAKFAGGLGVDWTPIRSTNSYIKGTNGNSQGLVPFLKNFNDVLVSVNQCFVPGTKVYTARGIIPIECVNQNDLILGKDGEYRRVTEVMEYPQDEPLVEIGVKHGIDSIRVTSGHPLFAITGVPKNMSNVDVVKRIERGAARIDWVEAGNLSKYDYVAQVVPTETIPVEGWTEADSRFYGMMLGNGHQTADAYEWGLAMNSKTSPEAIAFAREYLGARNIPFHESSRGVYLQIKWSSWRTDEALRMPFSTRDLYDCRRLKRISPRLSHLPRPQAVQMLRGLLETDGNVSRGKEVTFSNTSEELVDGMRYQLLRLSVPTSGTKRERSYNHSATRSDGSAVSFKGRSVEYVVRVPAVDEIAEITGATPLVKRNWITANGMIFTRVTSVSDFSGAPLVYDLKVEGVESYQTTNALAHNGGKRKGAGCAYLETWHGDIEDFLDLRKNTGDDRRRCHDMNTANWIPDLFMKRVRENAEWHLFSPSDCPDLHDLFGSAFEARYVEYETLARAGKIAHNVVNAKELWKKMLTAIFETGHPWITFKDPSNMRYSNQHVGVVHSSNLCCVTGDQRAVTSNGLVRVEDLWRDGSPNRVMGRDGVKNATEMALTIPNSPVVKVLTREGYSHKVTPDHPLWVVGRGWVEAQDLSAGDKIEIQQSEGVWGSEHRPDEAFLCGMIAGDGTFGSGGGTVFVDLWEKDSVLRDEIEAAVHRVIATSLSNGAVIRTNGSSTPKFRAEAFPGKWRLGSGALQTALSAFGFVRETKLSVPEFVWRGDKETVAAYLRGIYICDATIQATPKSVTAVSLSSVSRALLEDIQILWANFGVKTSLTLMRPAGVHQLPDGRGGSAQYKVQALYRLMATSVRACRIVEAATALGSHYSDTQFFANLDGPGYAQKMYATFKALERLPNEDVFCLKVDSDDHAWTCNGLVTKNTEILLHTVPTQWSQGEVTELGETAVCNLASINLAKHMTKGEIDPALIAATVKTLIRALDNVIDINFYPTREAEKANMRHRPVGMGIMGFHDALHLAGIDYDSPEAIRFADESMELVSYYAILASSELAAERGAYLTYPGSLWDQGKMPIDTYAELMAYRGSKGDMSSALDWTPVRAHVAEYGMRNSNTMAIAPTATISYIAGCSQSIEPDFSTLYVYSTLSGDFTMTNTFFVEDMKRRGLWCPELIDALKVVDGDISSLSLPQEVKNRYKTAFAMSQETLISCAAARQKWIDQGQSLNLYANTTSLKALNDMYMQAWEAGLKTTYYLRSKAASKVEKSTAVAAKASPQAEESACSIEARRNGEVCESCQ